MRGTEVEKQEVGLIYSVPLGSAANKTWRFQQQ